MVVVWATNSAMARTAGLVRAFAQRGAHFESFAKRRVPSFFFSAVGLSSHHAEFGQVRKGGLRKQSRPSIRHVPRAKTHSNVFKRAVEVDDYPTKIRVRTIQGREG